ncbi:hypothetical protein Moror_4168 [Moniliophthora roreri MCA 2997]|uniref:MYND-type domain-containing protein n=1 Tax=Moniliophthora roreri (strain MCA 2997) TaxID=1381753 RepID=V2YG89_MONRO|nr:hypothetical protein Moror_4168 [Moniliophthora roreri MCA 2997]
MSASFLMSSQKDIWNSALASSTPVQRHKMDRFLTDAGTTFPSRISAVAKLRQLGRPPSSSPDISHPCESARAVLDVFAYFAHYLSFPEYGKHVRTQTVSCIKQNWSSSICPWVEFFLQEFALNSEPPRTPEGLDFLDNILNVISLLLSYPKNYPDVREVKQIASRLRTQVLNQVWLKVIDTLHVTWWRWSALMTCIFFSDDEFNEFSYTMTKSGECTTTRVAFIGVQHLRRIAQHIDVMQEADLAAVHTSLLLMGFLIPPDPSFMSCLLQGSVPALVDLLSALFSRSKTIRRFSDSPHAWTNVLISVMIAISSLADAFVGPMWICQALDAGLLEVLFKSNRLIQGHQRISDKDREHLENIWARLNEMLKQVIVFMVYPSVLVRFLSGMKKLAETGVEEELEAIQPDWPLWDIWDLCQAKARGYRRTFERAKSDLGSLCCAKECPSVNSGALGSAEIRYLRCSACHSTTYCSRTCARQDWKAKHQKLCSSFAQQFSEGIPPPTYMDICIFQAIIDVSVHRNAEYLAEQLQNPHARARHDHPNRNDACQAASISARVLRHPLLLVTYDRFEEKNTNMGPTVQVIDLKTILCDCQKRRGGLAKDLVPKLHETVLSAQDDDFVVLAFFPVTFGRVEDVWPVIRVVPRPTSGTYENLDLVENSENYDDSGSGREGPGE